MQRSEGNSSASMCIDNNAFCVHTGPENVLEMMLAPVTPGEFFGRYWQREFLYVKRTVPKYYADLFSWTKLSQVIQEYPLLPPRLQLFQSGKQIPATEYIQSGPSRRLRLDAFAALLSRGATLILNQADRIHLPLRRQLYELEQLLKIPIQANLYAAWGFDEGFQLHWDEQDTFILQVAGKKRWTVYAPASEFPVRTMDEEFLKPDAKPVWEGVISEGDCFYVPRGWWHLVEPVGDATLHLTITCHMPTGSELMNWLIEQLSTLKELRLDVPEATSMGVDSYLSSLRTAVSFALSDREILARFWRSQAAQVIAPRSIHFPDLNLCEP